MSDEHVDRIELNGCPVTVIHLWSEPYECAMCGAVGFHSHAVPWYCGPVEEGKSDGGYKTVCAQCHDTWATWNDQQHEGDALL